MSMETSDSEYFESADEDFESDLEDESRQSTTSCQKLIEPQLCKLKIEDDKDIRREKYEKPSQEATSPELVVREEKQQPAAKEEASELVKEEPKSGDNSTILPPALDSPINLKTDETLNPVDPKALPGNPMPYNVLLEATEESLWDEDELDWGSEAVKDQQEKADESKLSTPDSKNQDSGWDDFEAEWESEPTSSNHSKPTNATTERSFSNGEDDEWESLEAPKDSTRPKQEQDGSWGLFSRWGISSMINTATASVSSITNNLSTALEGSIGIPAPEDLAKSTSNKSVIEPCDEPSTPFGFSNLVSGVTKFVESTGTKVISGGLDTLEAIGKKTVEVLQDGDPGLKKKRAFLKLDPIGKPNLSQILREAKEQAEKETANITQKDREKRRNKNYETLFDDHHGLVHLEALEMLSKLCSIKLDNINNSLAGGALKDMQETLEQVKELCELPEEDEGESVSIEAVQESLAGATKEINIPLSYEKLLKVYEDADVDMQSAHSDAADMHQRAIDTLAQLTALAMEQYHKAGELLLVKEHRSTADEADSLVQITSTIKALIRSQAEKFTDRLNSRGNGDKAEINDHITNIFYEAGNSATYIQDAFQLLIPVLQVGAV